MPSSRGSSQHRDHIWISRIVGGFFTIWATREAPHIVSHTKMPQTLQGSFLRPCICLRLCGFEETFCEFISALILAGGRDSGCLSHILIWFLAALLGLGRRLRSQSLGQSVWVTAVLSAGRGETTLVRLMLPLPPEAEAPQPPVRSRESLSCLVRADFSVSSTIWGRTSLAITHNCTIFQTPAMLNPPTEWLPITHHLQFTVLIKLLTCCFQPFVMTNFKQKRMKSYSKHSYTHHQASIINTIWMGFVTHLSFYDFLLWFISKEVANNQFSLDASTCLLIT